MTTVIEHNYYKLNSDKNGILAITQNYAMAESWSYSNSVVSQAIYYKEAIPYNIDYYNGVNLLNLTAYLIAYRQKTYRYLFNNTQILRTGTYGPNGIFVLGETFIYFNVDFNLATYSLTGYTLQWNTKSDLTGTNYNLSTSYTTNSSVSFYLKKTAITYNISWDLNSGTGEANLPTTIDYDSRLTFPNSANSPTRTGYTFAGWNDGTTTYAVDDFFNWNYTADKAYTAQWTAITYTIEYYDDTTKYTNLSPTSLTYGSTYTYPTQPAKTGYTFSGWFTEKALNTAIIASGTAWTYTTNQTFYAKFTAITYTLIYNLDGGTIADNPTTVTYDASYDLKNPVKTNYTFNGWFSDSNKTTSISTSGTTWKLTSVNIYAKYTINGYNLTYDTNNIGGAGKTYNTVIVGTTLTTQTSPPIHIPKAFGYTFNGWYDSRSGGNKIINSDGAGGYTMPATETTLYAQWTVKSDVRLRYLDDTFGNIAGNTKISISEYQNSISKDASTRTALKADFIGKGPKL